MAGTAPGTTVPMKVVRDRKQVTLNVTVEELDLQAEQQAGRRAPGEPGGASAQTETETGMSLRQLTQGIRRQLEVPAVKPAVVAPANTGSRPLTATLLAAMKPPLRTRTV